MLREWRAVRPWIGVEAGWRERGERPRLVRLTPSDMEKSVYCIGVTGTGKTNALIHLIAQDIVLGNSFVLVDVRGDLVDAVLDLLAGNVPVDRIYLLDLREPFPAGYDPLRAREGAAYQAALGALASVKAESGDAWGPLINQVFLNGFMLLGSLGLPLTAFEGLFYDEAFLRSCLEKAERGGVAEFWERFLRSSAEKRETFASPIMNKLSPLLAVKNISHALGAAEPVDIGRFLSLPGSVILVSLMGQQLQGSAFMVGRMFIRTVIREVFDRVGIVERLRNPVHCYIDEFEHFGTDEFAEILAEARKYKLSLILSHQSLSQLTPKLRAMILGNTGCKLLFRCSRADAKILSAELTGDDKELDLASLSTGHAVLWTRDRGTVNVEVNSPLVRDLGARTPRAKALADALRKRWGGRAAEAPGNDAASKTGQNEPASGGDRQPRPNTSLEDWLWE